jgi:hypothetical protein
VPKKTYEQLVRRRAQIREVSWQAFRRTPAFTRYYQENIDRVRKHVAELKKNEDAHNLPQPTRSSYDPEYHVIMDFLKLPEGQELVTRLGLSPVPRSIVRVSIMDGPARVLTFEINLAHSVTEIMAAFGFTLRRTRRRVLGRHRVSTVSPSPPIVRQDVEERQDRKFLLVEINLQHQAKDILKAVKLLLPRSRPTGPRQKQKRKVDPWKAWDTMKLEKSFRRAAWRLGVAESTLKAAFYQAFELVIGEPYRTRSGQPVPMPEINCKNCNKRSTCTTLCEPVSAYVRQSRRTPRLV